MSNENGISENEHSFSARNRGMFLAVIIIFCICVVLAGSRDVSAAVPRKTVSVNHYVTLRRVDGRVWKKIIVNGKNRFPAVAVGKGNMFLGWARSQGKSRNPAYFANDVIPAKNATYYMVVFRKNQNKAPASVVTSSKYKKVWFVGDSRTYGMNLEMKSSMPENVSVVCKCGGGLDWFKKTGYPMLLKQVQKEPVQSRKAVIINLGVNDLDDYSGYPSYMKKVSRTLKKYGCDMYYMSVNPINSAVIQNHQGRHRTEAQITAINKKFRRVLCSGQNRSYKYIDTYNYLRKNGWTCNANNDGVHYSEQTYRRIYDFAIRSIG